MKEKPYRTPSNNQSRLGLSTFFDSSSKLPVQSSTDPLYLVIPFCSPSIHMLTVNFIQDSCTISPPLSQLEVSITLLNKQSNYSYGSMAPFGGTFWISRALLTIQSGIISCKDFCNFKCKFIKPLNPKPWTSSGSAALHCFHLTRMKFDCSLDSLNVPMVGVKKGIHLVRNRGLPSYSALLSLCWIYHFILSLLRQRYKHGRTSHYLNRSVNFLAIDFTEDFKLNKLCIYI